MSNPTNASRTFSTRLRRPVQNVNPTSALPVGAFPNPFGESVQFALVDSYLDQLNQVGPPTVIIPNRFPSVTDVAANGITIELWFKAESSGSLVNLPMGTDPATPTAIAPLIYIDSNGLLRAGLFDSTQITLLSPPQNLIASQSANGVVVGPVNALASPLSVVDGQWHHAALVVQPGAAGTQSLFLDGRLAATGTPNGSFGLSFVASDGTTWTAGTTANVPLGGPITPQPAFPPNFLPYAQGFSGCLTELRIWNGPRIIANIQALMDQPLGSDLGPFEQQGLVGYVGASQLQALVQPTAYLSLVPDAPPFDPFTDIIRIPGYQNYGVCTAIPFTTVAPPITFPSASQPYSTKITLCQADQLQVSFPTDDVNKDGLNGTFSMTISGAASGQLQTINSIQPSNVISISAPATDCYRLDISYSTEVTVSNLQFMLVPGPNNTLMQLLLEVTPTQTSYSDPSYPTTSINIPDPRFPGQNKLATLNAYWPPFTDQTVFPINPNNFGATELLEAYLYLNEAATSIAQQMEEPTFSDFFNLCSDNAATYEYSDLSSLLDGAYKQQTKNNPPAPTITSFDSAYDQVYVFIYNVNLKRKTLNAFLTAYNGWALLAIDELALTGIPHEIANQVYAAQQNISTSLNGPSKGDFIANLIVGSVLWGLGAVFPILGPVEAIMLPVVSGFIGSAGANALSELFGASLGSTSVQAKLSVINYSSLDAVVNNILGDLGGVYTAIIGNLLEPKYIQTLYSNYGLLQALSYVNAQPLYISENNIIQPGPGNSLTTGITYASWKMLIPAVFTWTPQKIANNASLSGVTSLYQPWVSAQWLLQGEPQPPSIEISQVLSNDSDMLYSMIQQVQEWQTGTTSTTAQFFSVCPMFVNVLEPQEPGAFTGAWVIFWTLMDSNQNPMGSALMPSLFGIGGTNAVSLVDQNNPLAAGGYGWYCQIANAGVTTPFEAFMEWGEGVPNYSPQILLTQTWVDGFFDVQYEIENSIWVPGVFATSAAGDLPASPGVTLAPGTLNFGTVAIGSTSPYQSTVLKNNQSNNLQNIELTQSGSAAFKVGLGVSSELNAKSEFVITLSFDPAAGDPGAQTGMLTITATAQYGPVSLTVELSGTGVAPS
jgi:hypothetical protein